MWELLQLQQLQKKTEEPYDITNKFIWKMQKKKKSKRKSAFMNLLKCGYTAHI